MPRNGLRRAEVLGPGSQADRYGHRRKTCEQIHFNRPRGPRDGNDNVVEVPVVEEPIHPCRIGWAGGGKRSQADKAEKEEEDERSLEWHRTGAYASLRGRSR